MKNIFLCVFLVAGFFSFAQEGNSGFLIRPYVLEFNLNKGQEATQKIYIRNNLNEKVQFRLYINDWLRDTAGGHLYMPIHTLPHSCSQWVKIENEFIEVNPNEIKEINVKLTLPDSAEATNEMKWSMLFIETVREAKAPTVNSNGVVSYINNKMRLGVHIYQTPPSINQKEIKMLGFSPIQDKPNTYRITCENVGNVQVFCKGAIEILNLEDGKKTKLTKPIDFPIFPEQKRFFDFDLPAGLPKGKYTLIATVDAGEDLPLEAAQKTIEIN